MNTGIGDATNLAWKLAAVRGAGAADGLLDTYESERIGLAWRLVATADRIFTLMTKRGTFSEFVRLKLVPLVLPALLKLPAIRRVAFRTF